MTRLLDFDDGFESASEPTQGSLSFSALKTFANDAAFVTDKGSAAAEGDIYANTTNNSVRFFDGSSWKDALTDPTTTLGDLIANDGTGAARVAVGADGFVVIADSGASEGVSYNDGSHAQQVLSKQVFS